MIKLKRDEDDANKNVWFTSYLGNSTLFSSDTEFKIDGQIIGAGMKQEFKFKGLEYLFDRATYQVVTNPSFSPYVVYLLN